MTQPGLVSVIIPVRNRPVLLREAVESVLAQTYRPIEILIVDDSTDRTVDVIRELVAANPGVISVRPQDGRGIGAARNIGLAEARGEFIQFLDSDDVLMPDKFARQVAGLRANPACGISYCATREYRILAEPQDVAARRSGEALPRLFPALLRGRVWPSPSPLYRRSVTDAIGPFSHCAKYEDWDYEARAAALNLPLHHCPELLADKRDAHHVEGRRKGGVPLHQARDHADVVLAVYAAAQRAGVTADAFGSLAPRLFTAGRLCAAANDLVRARRCLELAALHAPPSLVPRVARYRALSNLLGWRLVGTAAESSSRAGQAARRAARWPAAAYRGWRHRARRARQITAGHPVARWPGLLAHAWNNRRSRPDL